MLQESQLGVTTLLFTCREQLLGLAGHQPRLCFLFASQPAPAPAEFCCWVTLAWPWRKLLGQAGAASRGRGSAGSSLVPSGWLQCPGPWHG